MKHTISPTFIFFTGSHLHTLPQQHVFYWRVKITSDGVRWKKMYFFCCFWNTFFLNIPPEPENRTSKITAKILIFWILFALIITFSQWPLSKHYSGKRLNNLTLLHILLPIKYHQSKLLWLEIHPNAWLTRGVSLEYWYMYNAKKIFCFVSLT